MTIQVFRPVMNTNSIVESLRPIFESGWVGLGTKTAEFEKAIADYIGVDAHRVVAVNSCTAALELAMSSMGLPEKSAVLSTPITFVSTNSAILRAGYSPVFYDIERTTGAPDIESVFRLCKMYDIKAITVVHIGGYASDKMDAINDIAKCFEMQVIEDCAHAMGARYLNGNKVGNSNNVCCFSFHAVKNLALGDGGAIVANSDHMAEWCRKARWLGINKDTISRTDGEGYKWDYDVEFNGWKCHLNDIAAVIGLEQLRRLDDDNARRRQIANRYFTIEGAYRPRYEEADRSSFHFYPLFFDDRKSVYDKLVSADIYPGMHYKRNDLYKPFLKCIKDECMDGVQWWNNHELTLPMHIGLSDEDVDKVIEVLSELPVS